MVRNYTTLNFVATSDFKRTGASATDFKGDACLLKPTSTML